MLTQHRPPRLLAGPPLGEAPERLDSHVARLGELPLGTARHGLIDGLEAAGLLGRGGAGFPVGRKWRSMAERRDGRAVVVVNGAEGEPASFKDRVLMASRPHLVIDGAALAAEAVGADEIVFYVGQEHGSALAAMAPALEARRTELGRRARLVTAPIGYVSGEATAAVHCINSGDARPTTSPPRMSERGVGGRPTLVQNVESLAYAALIARFGEQWYRSAGRFGTRGTALITLSGGGAADGVREIELGTTVGEVAEAAGARLGTSRAVILGGYFGTWARAEDAWGLPLDPEALREAGLTFGCGIVGVLRDDVCGVSAAARIMRYMARESAAQCGPCVYGLDALGSAVTRVATGHARDDDLTRIDHLTAITAGRGACHHPDGAVQHMASALEVFGDEFRHHARTGRCSITGDRTEGD